MVFDLAHLPYWIFLGVGVLLFLLVIFSGGDDSDVDIDGDVDVDIDADADIDVDANADLSALQALGWLGVGQAPLLLLLAIDFTLWGLIGWILNLLFGLPAGWFGNSILILSLILSLLAGSAIAKPIGKMFISFSEDTSSDRLVGCTGTVVSQVIPKQPTVQIGQVDVTDSSNNLVSINVQVPDWASVTPQRGEKVVIIEYCQSFYLAIAKGSVDEQRWLG